MTGIQGYRYEHADSGLEYLDLARLTVIRNFDVDKSVPLWKGIV